ncbi:hypothetical protein RCH11_003006 [Glaciihabitans sp. GrIS 2.15]|nr:hypothetical protein [Glaciihabitans sp. GrIS 2.15]
MISAVSLATFGLRASVTALAIARRYEYDR